MERWKQEVIDLHDNSKLPEHCGSGWSAWQLEAVRDDLIRKHADEIILLFRQQERNRDLFTAWVADVAEQAAMQRREGHQTSYDHSSIPAMVVSRRKK